MKTATGGVAIAVGLFVAAGFSGFCACALQAQSAPQEAERIPGEVVSFTAQLNEEDSRAANVLDGRPDVAWRAGSRPPTPWSSSFPANTWSPGSASTTGKARTKGPR